MDEENYKRDNKKSADVMIEQRVIKVKPNQITSIVELLRNTRGVFFEEPKSRYESFRVIVEKNPIVGYTTGKIVYRTSEKTDKIISEILSKVIPYEYDIVIGSDEAGKGELTGPMTIGAVALFPKQMSELQLMGVMDSKELSLERIENLFDKITKNCLSHRGVIISPKRFNELFDEVKDEGKTLNDLLAWGHATAIYDVIKKLDLQNKKYQIIIDEFDRIKTDKRLNNILKTFEIQPNQIVQKPRAEEEVAVACASIIARAVRERWMARKSKELKIDLKGITPDKIKNNHSLINYVKKAYLKDL